jgi:transposase
MREIGRRLNRPHTTIKSSLDVEGRVEGCSLLRIGGPKKLTDREERAVLRIAWKDPKISYKDLLQQARLTLKQRHTVYRVLKEHGITKWRSKQRPFLTILAAKIRLEWADNIYLMLSWESHLPDNICWSDECSIYQQGGLTKTWSFGTPERKWDRECIDPVKRERGPHVMVWACFCRGRRSRLMFMERDPDSPRTGYTAVSYTDVLGQELQRFMHANNYYMHDNAPIHTARWTSEWLRSRGISMFEPCWPPWSPDLNPIEHVWHKLRDMLLVIDPTLHEASGTAEEVLARLQTSLLAAWEAIPQSFFDALIDTWFHRVDAVRQANGWYTKY